MFKLARKNFSEILDTKGGGNQFFKFGVGEKKEGGTKIFPKSQGGNQSHTHYGSILLTAVKTLGAIQRQKRTKIGPKEISKYKIAYYEAKQDLKSAKNS